MAKPNARIGQFSRKARQGDRIIWEAVPQTQYRTQQPRLTRARTGQRTGRDISPFLEIFSKKSSASRIVKESRQPPARTLIPTFPTGNIPSRVVDTTFSRRNVLSKFVDTTFPRRNVLSKFVDTIFSHRNVLSRFVDTMFPAGNVPSRVVDTMFPTRNVLSRVVDSAFPRRNVLSKRRNTRFQRGFIEKPFSLTI